MSDIGLLRQTASLAGMSMYMYKIVRLFRPLALAALLSVLGSGFAVAAEIAVTLPPLAGLVAMLDQKVDVLCLLSNGSDPHHFQLSPRKIEALRQTRLLIRASRDDGGWPLPPHHAHSLDVWPALDHGWLNPATVREVLPRIATALIALHPERQQHIEAALSKALAATHQLEDEWRQSLQAAQQDGVLMQHPAWRRLMLAMHVPVLDVLESGQHGHEFGPHKLEHALVALHAHQGAWLIAGQGHSNRALDWLDEHAKISAKRVTLDALGTCTQTWPQLMQENLKRWQAVSDPS